MIVEGIVKVVVAFFEFALGLLPTRSTPGWMDDMGASMNIVWGHAAGLGAWIPWSTVAYVIGAVVACMIFGLQVRLARIVISLFTGGGGSAA